MRVTEEEIESARDVDLRDLVELGDHQYKRYIDHLKMVCLFHEDKNPSLAIYPNGFFCFACGERGDQIDWVMKTEDLSFADAVRTINNAAEE